MNLDDINKNPKALVTKMFNCFQKSSSIKQFCEDINEQDESLLSCFKLLQVDSNIQQEDIDKLEAKIKCKTDSETADQYYECLKKPKDTLDFCYDQFMIDSDPNEKGGDEAILSLGISDKATKASECVDNSKDDKFDDII